MVVLIAVEGRELAVGVVRAPQMEAVLLLLDESR